ncbi:hypothetical protein [Tumebacillus permanentifrigoris]|uniref:Peptide zinc metalloprotease protein n=1 Tax=Tumebacillus permanentifrigoris TaxID=378543 RepID=A0A316DS48_9BACL|nr:hypothetical protein [Tumebacillus permanentifrigoris]PWK08365.1 hypothetical protein C7459_11516 [Tumebacillus permanentifrigoris]
MEEQRKVYLHDLTYLPEEEGVSIGRYGTDTFAVFPEDGAELLKRLAEGMTIGDATRWYRETYHEDLDMDDFLDTLRELEYLREDEAGAETTDASSAKLRGQTLGRWMFSPPAFVLYAGLFAASLVLMYTYPELRPHRNHIFFTEYATVVILGLFLGQFPGILFHESMHILAGRRLGLPTKMSVGRRMYILVFQASMPGIHGLPRRQRYLPFLAGMMGDVIWFSLLVLTAGLTIVFTGELNLFAKFCVALSFTTILRFVWQFYFHLQTDIYYVIVTVLGCVNLQQTTREYLKNFWWRLIGASHKAVDPSNWAERDAQVARWYGPLYAIGYSLMILLLIFVMLPVAYRFLSGVFWNLLYGTSVHMWDSLVFVLVNGINYGVVIWVYLRERRARRRQKNQSTIVQGG